MDFGSTGGDAAGAGERDFDFATLAGTSSWGDFSRSTSPSEDEDLALLLLFSGAGGGGGGGDSGDSLPCPLSGEGDALCSGDEDALRTFLSGFFLAFCSLSLSELWSLPLFLGVVLLRGAFLGLSGLLAESLSEDGDLCLGDFLRGGFVAGEVSLFGLDTDFLF